MEFKTDGNDTIINGKKYKGTEVLWEPVTSKEPKTSAYDDEDMKKIFRNYGKHKCYEKRKRSKQTSR